MTDPRYVLLTTAPTSFHAEWIVGALKGVDIEAMTAGDGPADEFTMAQRVTGGGGVEVFVPEAELADARELLADIEGAGEQPGLATEAGATADDPDSGEPATPPASPSTRAHWIAIGILSVVLAWALWKLSQAPPAADENALFRGEWQGGAWIDSWRESGRLARKSWDADRDGIFEEMQMYDRSGRLYQVSFDSDQDGVIEKWYTIFDGLRTTYFDENENFVAERVEIERPDGVVERWLDRDEDAVPERREFVRRETGQVLWAEEDRGLDEGFVRVR